MRRRAHGDSEEIGWISTCDLLLLMLAVSMLLMLVAAGHFASARASAEVGETTIAELEDEMRRLRNELGIWTVSAERSEAELTRARDELSAADLTAQSFGSTIKDLTEKVKQAEKARDDAEELARRTDAGRAEAERAAAEVKRAAAEAEERLTRAVSDLETASRRTTELQTSLAKAEERAKKADDRAKGAEAQRAAAAGSIDTDKRIRQELLGIPGSLGRVVFVVDRSQSMNEGGRWKDAKRTIAAWIEHLPVEYAALVVFDSGVAVVPEMGASSSSPAPSPRLVLSTTDSRRAMLDALDSMEPRGLTQTYKGLQAAMRFSELDAIVLFTDGAPDPPDSGGTADPRAQVLQLVSDWKKRNPKSRLHAVGIGDYFRPVMRDFLLGVAERGEGAFIGR
jgi:hypothetical protein